MWPLYRFIHTFREANLGDNVLWRASLMAQRLKCLPAMQETWVQSLGWEDPLEKEMATSPVFLPGESHGRMSLVGYSPRGHKESDTTERLHFTVVWSYRNAPYRDVGKILQADIYEDGWWTENVKGSLKLFTYLDLRLRGSIGKKATTLHLLLNIAVLFKKKNYVSCNRQNHSLWISSRSAISCFYFP